MEYESIFISCILRELKTQRRMICLIFVKIIKHRKTKLNVSLWKIKTNHIMCKIISLDKGFEIL
nr:hypothetical protein CparaKRNrm2_p062 [Cryptomonas paramecium]